MNYPIWEIWTIGGPFFIAVISILHVFVAHFAVGGGLFLVLTEIKARREQSPEMLAFTRRHAKFFMLLTMVFGNVTGVGIWFIIALVHPAATSILIHTFVFGWAIEWVFFVGEIVCLFVYFYTFEKMSSRDHLTVGWLYFVFAWLSLLVINGIVGFMLTPGTWAKSGDFWEGFLNPSFFPSLGFRTFLSLMIAGLFGFLTATRVSAPPVRDVLVRYTARWLYWPILALPVFAYWYLSVIPEGPGRMILGASPEMAPFVRAFLSLMPVLFVGGILMAVRLPFGLRQPLAWVLLFCGLAYMGSFEWIREGARRPFIIQGLMFSTGVLPSQEGEIQQQGMLATARWVREREPGPKNVEVQGKALFNLQCLPCHTVNGLYKDIIPLTKDWTYRGMVSQLTGQGRIKPYMPPFMGTEKEKEVLASFIAHTLHQRPKHEEKPFVFEEQPFDMPSFDPAPDACVLLAWNDLGMHCVSDNDRWFSILPPANTLEAVLIRRGETPEPVVEDVILTYRVESGFASPWKEVDFWEWAQKVYGRRLPEGTGLAGKGLEGEMVYDPKGKVYVAEKVPVVPYRDVNGRKMYNPYPLFTIEAKDRETGKLLARTEVVAPVSTEMGCRNCHGGPWRWNGISGISDETATNILRVHDRNSKTDLLKRAEKGEPLLCQGCHADPALNAQGRGDVLNLSAAMHGWHAVYMSGMEADACALCHPASLGGNTRCGRDIHTRLGISCVTCHGHMEDHSISLNKGENSKPQARSILAALEPQGSVPKEEIRARTPWVNEPDCLSCHEGFEKPVKESSGFNQWTEKGEDLYRMRFDETASLRCIACHGATHALYPAINPVSRDRDTIQPLQYGKMPYPIGSNETCTICHSEPMEDEAHHANMARAFRNVVQAEHQGPHDPGSRGIR